jgi:HEAT repeat protein
MGDGGEQVPAVARVSRLTTQLTEGPSARRVAAAHELDEVARARPEAVQPAVPALHTALADRDESVRAAAAVALAGLARSDRSAALSAATDLAALLSDATPTANNALSALIPLLGADPDATLSAVAPQFDELVALAGAETPVVRQRAVRLLLAFAREQPERVGDAAVQALLRVVERPATVSRESLPEATDGPTQRFIEFAGRQTRRDRSRRGGGRQMAAAALAHLASERPDAVAAQLHRVRGHLNDADPTVRVAVVDCVGRTATAAPADVGAVVAPLTDAMSDPTEPTVGRVTAATSLEMIAEVDPDRVAEAVTSRDVDFVDLLDADDDGLRGATVCLLSSLVGTDAEIPLSDRSKLRDLLRDGRWFVRERAATALGHLGEDPARSRLTELHESDPEPPVRRAAATALRRLDGVE